MDTSPPVASATSTPAPAGVSTTAKWVGRVLSAPPVLLMLFSASLKLMNPPAMAASFTHLGYNPSIATPLGLVEVACAILYMIPRTRVLGAILVTGYLGGATATHVRIGESAFVMPVLLGILAWLGLLLRDARLRELLPLTR